MQEVGEKKHNTKSFFMFGFNEKLCFCYYATSLPLKSLAVLLLVGPGESKKFMGKVNF